MAGATCMKKESIHVITAQTWTNVSGRYLYYWRLAGVFEAWQSRQDRRKSRISRAGNDGDPEWGCHGGWRNAACAEHRAETDSRRPDRLAGADHAGRSCLGKKREGGEPQSA